ncbi:helix-turn-helix transcriptional regulator [Tepidibacillus fermentans]|uniref:Helix-turn-helix protein n=1 Tax=Tepidibacillus fermentans TaxID=1281767 RepID=A0A4R3KBD1_9BACI|nr:helix-turn-helix transcriptional regulator [Tepidibacillus fermentans]TCS80348.1 helix-turn-helix protein [Tepidibacillus fermentans]
MNSLPKLARLSAGLSIEDAAKKLGIPAGYLSQIENGLRQVSAERAEQIAKLYKKKKEEIFLPSRYAIREVNDQSTA